MRLNEIERKKAAEVAEVGGGLGVCTAYIPVVIAFVWSGFVARLRR